MGGRVLAATIDIVVFEVVAHSDPIGCGAHAVAMGNWRRGEENGQCQIKWCDKFQIDEERERAREKSLPVRIGRRWN